MAASFTSTLSSLEQSERWIVGLLPALLLGAAWFCWAFAAEVDVYVSATGARLEASHMTHRVTVAEGGRIVALRCELGQEVEAGELLAELDGSVEQARLAQERTQLDGARAEIQALQKQIEAERAQRRSRSLLDELAAERASFELQRALAAVSQKEAMSEIVSGLREERLSSRVEALNVEGELEQSRIQVDGARTELDRARAARQHEDNLQVARRAELERQLAALSASERERLATIELSERQLERRRVRAPASGRIGNITPLQLGDVVQAGDVMATIVPSSGVRVVAEFAPERALGRIVCGQHARVRLSGFAWTEFGTIDATVLHVASEPRAGTIRVELGVDATRLSAIPIQHGLPGAVDVRVEQATPWSLLLRSIGAALTPSSRGPSVPESIGSEQAS